jgi:hypothetical protein
MNPHESARASPSIRHPLLAQESGPAASSPTLRPAPTVATSFDQILAVGDSERPRENVQQVQQPVERSTSRSSRFLDHLRLRTHHTTTHKLTRSPTRQEGARQRAASKDRVKQEKRQLKETVKEEKARNQWLGGLAWGFDPLAGQPRNRLSTSTARWLRHTDQDEKLRRQHGEGSREYYDQSFGVEVGGPSKHGNYDYRLLSSTQSQSRL